MRPYLIIGQGIAGSLLAWRLEQAGVAFEIVDSAEPGAASRIAPGLVNPLAGEKLKPSWRIADQIPAHEHLYREMEAALEGGPFFHKLPMLRVLKNAKQREHLVRRQSDPEAKQYIAEVLPPGALGPGIEDPHGSFVTCDSGWLDVAGLLAALRKRWLAMGILHQERVGPEAIKAVDSFAVWRGKCYETAVLCTGWRARENPLFQTPLHNPARGEMLTLELTGPGFLPARFAGSMLNGPKWLLPLGHGRYRAGASYAWDDFEAPPGKEKRDEIINQLRSFVHADFKVLDHVYGVRPATNDFRPICGRHPEHPRLAIFGGLGSKGVMVGPWLSELVAKHLLEGQELPEEVHFSRGL